MFREKKNSPDVGFKLNLKGKLLLIAKKESWEGQANRIAKEKNYDML